MPQIADALELARPPEHALPVIAPDGPERFINLSDAEKSAADP